MPLSFPRLGAVIATAALLAGCASLPDGGYSHSVVHAPAYPVYDPAPVYSPGYHYPAPPPRYVPYAPAPVYVQPRPVWVDPPVRRPHDRDHWRERERDRDRAERDRAERDRWARERERDRERARREMADRMARPAPPTMSPGQPPGGYPPSDWRSRQYSNQGEIGAGP